MRDYPHLAIARRLKRANGHLETIIEMVENNRPCAEIAQQLQAVESAIESADSRPHQPQSRTVLQNARLEGAGSVERFQADFEIFVR